MFEIAPIQDHAELVRLEGLDDESLLGVSLLVGDFLDSTVDEFGIPCIPRDTSIQDVLRMMACDEAYGRSLTKILGA